MMTAAEFIGLRNRAAKLPRRVVTRAEFMRLLRTESPGMTDSQVQIHTNMSQVAGSWCMVGNEMLQVKSRSRKATVAAPPPPRPACRGKGGV